MAGIHAVVLRTVAFGLPLSATGVDAPELERYAWGLPTQGATTRRYLLLTFDDGPRPETTLTIARYLHAEGIPAVFFVNGIHFDGPTPWARRNRAIVTEVSRLGFDVGNHGYRHAHLSALSPHEIERDVLDNERLIRQATGATPWLFRPPYGGMSERVHEVIEGRGLTRVDWNLGAADFIEQTPGGLVQTFRNRLRKLEERGLRGGIVNLHDAHLWTVQAVPLLVDWVRHRNCELFANDEELYEFVDFSRFFLPRGRHPFGISPGQTFAADEPSIQQSLERQGRLRAWASRACRR